MKNNKYVFTVTGAAGSDKTTVANYLRDHCDMYQVITHIARLPRSREQSGVDYHFETLPPLKRLHLLEQVTYGQFRYGSSLEGLVEERKQGGNDVIVLDTAGVIAYHHQFGAQAVIIFLTVTHMTSLVKRMTLRGDKLSATRSRLYSKRYHRDLALPVALKRIVYVVVNDRWKNTEQQIDIIIRQILLKES